MAFAVVQCILTCEHSLVFLGVEGAPILYSIGGFLSGLNQIDLMLPPILVFCPKGTKMAKHAANTTEAVPRFEAIESMQVDHTMRLTTTLTRCQSATC